MTISIDWDVKNQTKPKNQHFIGTKKNETIFLSTDAKDKKNIYNFSLKQLSVLRPLAKSA